MSEDAFYFSALMLKEVCTDVVSSTLKPSSVSATTVSDPSNAVHTTLSRLMVSSESTCWLLDRSKTDFGVRCNAGGRGYFHTSSSCFLGARGTWEDIARVVYL
jgi:hypothetical protein